MAAYCSKCYAKLLKNAVAYCDACHAAIIAERKRREALPVGGESCDDSDAQHWPPSGGHPAVYIERVSGRRITRKSEHLAG